jgi:mono/diheme cytochrome c family protein
MRKIALVVMILGVLAFVAAPAFSEDGAAVYKAKCAMCHGEDGVAKKMAEPSRNLNDPKFQAEVSKEAVVQILTDGKGKKKSMKDKLTPEQITAVADYVKTMK